MCQTFFFVLSYCLINVLNIIHVINHPAITITENIELWELDLSWQDVKWLVVFCISNEHIYPGRHCILFADANLSHIAYASNCITVEEDKLIGAHSIDTIDL